MAARFQKNMRVLKKAYPWISTPLVVSAPMRVFAGPALAIAVSNAGGIGFIGPGPKPSDLSNSLSQARKLLSDHNISPLPIGIGFQTFDGDLDIASSAIQQHVPAVVWLFAPRNGQMELDAWTKRIRSVSPRTQIWIQVGSVKDAVLAGTSESPPDVLVLQGSDAGGHGLSRGAGIMTLIPETSDALRINNVEIPLIAAGGIADGRGIAAALSLGAVGAAMGTRFLASSEATISKGYQDDIIRTVDGGQNTVRTKLYDQLAGRTNWPIEYDGRNVLNQSFVDAESGMNFSVNQKLYREAAAMGDDGWGSRGRMTAYVGAGVGMINKVANAEEIIMQSREVARLSLGAATTCA